MRLPIAKVYRAFPELDRFTDEQCQRLYDRAAVYAAYSPGGGCLAALLGGAVLMIMLAIVGGGIGGEIEGTRSARFLRHWFSIEPDEIGACLSVGGLIFSVCAVARWSFPVRGVRASRTPIATSRPLRIAWGRGGQPGM